MIYMLDHINNEQLRINIRFINKSRYRTMNQHVLLLGIEQHFFIYVSYKKGGKLQRESSSSSKWRLPLDPSFPGLNNLPPSSYRRISQEG